MKPSQLKTYLKSCVTYNESLAEKALRGERVSYGDYQRPAIIGGVGLGKSSVVMQASEEMGYSCWQYEAANSDPSDLAGIPYIDGEFVKFRRVEELPRPGERKNIFFDEVGQCDRHQFNPIAKIVNDHSINGHKISDYTTVILAWNPVSARAGSVKIGTNVLTRVSQITMTPDVNDWCAYAREARVDEKVIGFIMASGLAVLEDFSPTREVNANPRTWVAAARTLELGLTKTLEMEAFAGCVGSVNMANFYKYIAQRHTLPKTADIHAKPHDTDLPDNPSAIYSVVTSLIGACEVSTFKASLDYISRTNSTEFVMFFLNGLAQRDKNENRTLANKFSALAEYNRVLMQINSVNAN